MNSNESSSPYRVKDQSWLTHLAREQGNYSADFLVLLVCMIFTMWTLYLGSAATHNPDLFQEYFYFLFKFFLAITTLNLAWVQVRFSSLIIKLADKKRREELAFTLLSPNEYLRKQIIWPLIRLFLPLVCSLILGAVILPGLLIEATKTFFKLYEQGVIQGRGYFILFPPQGYIIISFVILAGVLTMALAIILGAFSCILIRLRNACQVHSSDFSRFNLDLFLGFAFPFLQVGSIAFISILIMSVFTWPAFHNWQAAVFMYSIPLVFMILLSWYNFCRAKQHWKQLCGAYFEL